MRQELHAEWTKLRTVAGTRWLLAGCVVVTVALSAAVSAAVTWSAGEPLKDITKLSLSGIQIGQTVVAILAVLAITDEYSTGMIRTTLAAMPHRASVLCAKAFMVTAMALAAGFLAVPMSLLAGRFFLPGKGFTPSHGYLRVLPADGSTLRAAVGSVLYLALVGLLSLGIATLVRDAAESIGIVLALLYVFPVLTHVVSDPHWQRHLQQMAPMQAGLAIQNTVNLHGAPLSPWAGLGVLAVWAAGALLLGGLVLSVRDA
ncbi:MAG: ABC transporter permease [Actinomycetota bacterium]